MLTLICVCRYYSTQQYFDANGMFISVMFSAPLLFNCMLMVVSISNYLCIWRLTVAVILGHFQYFSFFQANWLLISSELMTNLRRFQLQEQIRRKQQQPSNGRSSEDNPRQSSSSSSIKKRSKERSRKDWVFFNTVKLWTDTCALLMYFYVTKIIKRHAYLPTVYGCGGSGFIPLSDTTILVLAFLTTLKSYVLLYYVNDHWLCKFSTTSGLYTKNNFSQHLCS